ncbi:hypothetical protein [Blastopirellula marina]|uniref:Uncharacterized protein n=1 Tax=Blastopirellula marina TaxID=124 RepID=A0A2S8GQ57_9BACT|nr:hypothetical protein [Blastopirellula marina]PQO46566.1 hypothetical protein C5Y93_08835 [Blastopirellula marina]
MESKRHNTHLKENFGLGRVLAEQGRWTPINVMGLLMILFIVALFAGAIVLTRPAELGLQAVFAAAIVGFTCYAGFLVYHCLQSLQVCEYGVISNGFPLRFDEISSFALRVDHQRAHKVIYISTTSYLTIVPSSSTRRKITFRWVSTKREEPGLKEFTERLTRYLTQEILETVCSGDRFDWSSSIALMGNCVRVTRRYDVPIELPYDQISLWMNENDGNPTAFIRERKTQREVARIEGDSLNYYPGFTALRLLIEATNRR